MATTQNERKNGWHPACPCRMLDVIEYLQYSTSKGLPCALLGEHNTELNPSDPRLYIGRNLSNRLKTLDCHFLEAFPAYMYVGILLCLPHRFFKLAKRLERYQRLCTCITEPWQAPTKHLLVKVSKRRVNSIMDILDDNIVKPGMRIVAVGIGCAIWLLPEYVFEQNLPLSKLFSRE